MINPPLVYCRPDASIDPPKALLQLLEHLFSVKFVSSQPKDGNSVGELITEVQGPTANGRAVSSLKVPAHPCVAEESKSIELAVRFADDNNVPFPFRGRLFQTKVAVLPEALTLKPGDAPLATCDVGTIWAHSHARGVRHFSSSLRLPILPAGGALQDVLGDNCFLQMLPLIQWLREISGSNAYSDPRLRACFIFDDPNLHWPSYGFVDYKKLAERAAACNYHVCFATIPLDTWYTHSGAAEIFRSHKDFLSLAVHGNDHTKRELGRAYSADQREFLLHQAVQRIERFERKTGIAVSKVMVPPHGACSEEMLGTLPLCGFEAACISHGSLRAHNRTRVWTNSLGYRPSELVQGCPVLPRWGLSGDVTNRILRAAFFGQPIILRGHQQDLKNGVELLDDLAGFINQLGEVTWSHLTDIARSNYQSRRSGTTLCVRPLGHAIVCSVHTGVQDLLIENSVPGLPQRWTVLGRNNAPILADAGQRVPLSPAMGDAVSIQVAREVEQSFPSVSIRPRSLALARRFLTEGRDRFLSLR